MSRFAFLAALSLAAPAYAQVAYFAAIDDLPLAPGLREVAAPGFAIDGGGGRVVGASAQGNAAPASVLAFYVETMPALGWGFSPGGEDLVFQRGRERLVLTIAAEGAGSRLDVRLFVRPAPGN